MAIANEIYELSIWKDIINNSGQLNDEQRLAVIGATDATSPLFATDITLKESTNGEKTLTFTMLRQFIQDGELQVNPFVNMLTTESKVKLRVDTQPFISDANEDIRDTWIDFVIKSVDESSDNYLNTYTAKEIFINELGKNGYAVTLDSELMNNYGTINELAGKILEQSEWEVDPSSYSPTEFIAQPLFICKLAAELSNTTTVKIVPTPSQGATIPSNEYIYPTYDSIVWDSENNQWKFKTGEIQFLYKGTGLRFTATDADDNGLIIDNNFEYNYSTTSTPSLNGGIVFTGDPSLTYPLEPLQLQGKAIQKGIDGQYEPTTKQYVSKYTVSNSLAGAPVNTEVFKYIETKYSTSSIVKNYIANPNTFTSSLAWFSSEPAVKPDAVGFQYNNPDTLTNGISVVYKDSKITFSLVNAALTGTIRNNITGNSYTYTSDDYSLSPVVANQLDFEIDAINLGITETGGYSLTYSVNIAVIPTEGSINYLKLPLSHTTARTFYNEGPSSKYNSLNLEKDRIYVVRLRGRLLAKDAKNLENIPNLNQPQISVQIGTYTAGQFTSKVHAAAKLNLPMDKIDNSSNSTYRGYAKPTIGTPRVSYQGTSADQEVKIDEYGYTYAYIKANASTNAETDRIHVSVNIAAETINNLYDYYIEDIQFFEYQEDAKGLPIFIGDVPTSSITFINHYYHIVNGLVENLSSDDSYYTPIYKDNYQAIRHIEIKESNYFNSLTSLAELFEVWIKFKVKHLNNGKILYTNGVPSKTVVFSQYAPNGDEYNQTGFKYGINIAGIKRTTDSNDIATKVIVKNNNQEFAKDGSAAISRAISNPSGENEIFNFNYFVNQGLIDYTQLLRDSYGLSSQDLALFPTLKEINTNYNTHASLLNQYINEISLAQGYYDYYVQAHDTATKDYDAAVVLLGQISSTDEAKYESQRALVALLNSRISAYKQATSNYKNLLTQYTNLRNSTEIIVNNLLDQKKTLKAQFFNKYSRFIQEGTWTDDKYIDDELYYLDSVKISKVSGFPKVNYNINVTDISQSIGYEAYDFKIGNKTFIEDTDFFGWAYKNIDGIGVVKTPFKMEVIVTERVRNFSDPSKSSISIQNYKNEFQELFQKLTATTQTLAYASGGYDRAAAAISQTGELNPSTLEKAMQNNAFVLSNSQNQSVQWDSGKGIEIIDTNNSSIMLRLVAGGIFMTTDGGRTWINGISGQGINTHALTAGQVDTSLINIMSKGNPIFRWDDGGISAFKTNELDNTYSATQYVRFNQYGLYGTTNGAALKTALDLAENFDDKIDAITNNSNFSLTWNGLHLNAQGGASSLTPWDGLQVFSPNKKWTPELLSGYAYKKHFNSENTPIEYVENDLIPLVSLGKVVGAPDTYNTETIRYGLRLRNDKGEITLDTSNEGNLSVLNKLTVGSPDPILPPGGSEGIWRVVTLDGRTTDNDEYSNLTQFPVFYAGDPNINQDTLKPNAKFQVFGDGKILASDADITGNITANSGYFQGEIAVGETSGINGGIGAEYSFWSGDFNANSTTLKLEAPIAIQPSGSFDLTGIIDPSWVTITTIYVSIPTRKDELPLVARFEYPLLTLPDDTVTTLDALTVLDISRWYVTPEGYLYAKGAYFEGNGVFTGTIQASSGYFKGEIRAQSGSFDNSIYIGEGSKSFIGNNNALTDPSTLLLSINDGKFGVNRDGDIFGNALLLVKDSEWTAAPIEQQYNILIGSSAKPGYIFEAFQPNTLEPQTNRLFGITNAGSVYIGGTLTTSDNLIFDGSLVSTNGQMTIDGVNNSITVGTTPKINGWGIYGDGSAYFSNVTVRGTLSSVVFEDNKVSSIGGELMISPSVTLIREYLVTVNNIFDISDAVPTSSNSSWLGVTEVLVSMPGGNDIKNCICTVTENPTVITIQLPLEQTYTSLPSGTVIIATITSNSSIKLSAKDPMGGYISLQGPGSNTLIGNLNSISSNVFGSNLGYGLFADNVYLTGKMYLPNAGITNTTTTFNDSEIRFWAGKDSTEMTSAPFIVTQDGSLYATKGIFSGQINATNSIFSGTIKAAGIEIDKNGSTAEDHFFVSYPSIEDDSSGNPIYDPNTYVLNIDNRGLSVWEGGLNIFSDYYSGFQGTETTPTGIKNSYYGYDKTNNPNPWSIFSIIDTGFNNSSPVFIPRLSQVHTHVWFNNGTSIASPSSKIQPGRIDFTNLKLTGNEGGYVGTENAIWNAASVLSIGNITVNGIAKTGLQSNTISLANSNTEALVIKPQTTGGENTSTTTLSGFLNFGSSVQISQDDDGIIFTYIGNN